MPTLQELRNTWFLSFGPGDAPFPPARRHAGTAVSNYTDGNNVKPLLEGDAYMKVWHDEIVAMHGAPGAELYHAGWRMEDVHTLGQSNAVSDALRVIREAQAAGADVKMMLSRHGGGAFAALNRVTSISLILSGVKSACMDNRFPPRGGYSRDLSRYGRDSQGDDPDGRSLRAVVEPKFRARRSLAGPVTAEMVSNSRLL